MRALLIILALTLSGASVMAGSREPPKMRGSILDNLDPRVAEGLSTDAPFSWMLRPGQPTKSVAPKGEAYAGPTAPLPRDRPPHIKPEWEAKLRQWEAEILSGNMPSDPDFMAYVREREKQLMQNPAWQRMIDQRSEEMRALMNEKRTGVPEKAM